MQVMTTTGGTSLRDDIVRLMDTGTLASLKLQSATSPCERLASLAVMSESHTLLLRLPSVALFAVRFLTFPLCLQCT